MKRGPQKSGNVVKNMQLVSGRNCAFPCSKTLLDSGMVGSPRKPTEDQSFGVDKGLDQVARGHFSQRDSS